MPSVFLVRHGESQSNVGLPTDYPERAKLTIHGIEQAKHVAAYLKSHTSLDRIIISRYQRTKETATFTQSLFPSVNLVEQWEVQEFTYLSSMHQEHLTVQERRPLVEVYWDECRPDYVDGPGSESFESFIKRVRAFLALLQSAEFKATETIAVFSHEQFITAILWLTERNPSSITSQAMRDFKSYLRENRIPNGAIARMQFPNRQRIWRIKRITEHLQEQISVQREWAWAQEQKILLPAGP